MNRILIVTLAAALFCSGCSVTKQARSVEKSGYLGDDIYALVQEGKGGESLLIYRNEQVNPTKYTSVMIDKVSYINPKDASKDELADLQKLATNFAIFLKEELGKDYRIVTTPGPGTVRYSVAITSADDSNRLFEVTSLIPPYGMAISLAKDFITGKPTAVGEISMEIKAVDAETGELLGAAVDRRVGGKTLSGMMDTWDDANNAMRYWAKRVRYVNCLGSKRPSCEKP
jgi:hypothetical protein